MSSEFSKLRRNLVALAASLNKSSSSKVVLSNSATTSLARRRLASGQNFSAKLASSYSKPMSERMRSSISGRNTLTMTLSPVCNVAVCTCATEAEAKGEASNSAKASLMDIPSSASIMPLAMSLANGGTRSCSLTSSSAMSSGKMSLRVDKAWPNLT